jgi:hypothetical protein
MLTLWTATLLAAAPLPPKPADPSQPRLVFKNKDFLVHAWRAKSRSESCPARWSDWATEPTVPVSPSFTPRSPPVR